MWKRPKPNRHNVTGPNVPPSNAPVRAGLRDAGDKVRHRFKGNTHKHFLSNELMRALPKNCPGWRTQQVYLSNWTLLFFLEDGHYSGESLVDSNAQRRLGVLPTPATQ